MPMYSLIEYSDKCLKTSASLWQYYRDEAAIDDNNNIFNFPGNSESFTSS